MLASKTANSIVNTSHSEAAGFEEPLTPDKNQSGIITDQQGSSEDRRAHKGRFDGINITGGGEE